MHDVRSNNSESSASRGARTNGRAHVRFLRACCAFLLISSSAGAASPPGETPPPIPRAEERARFLAAHEAVLDEARLAAPPRAAHDEYAVDHYDVSLDLDIDNTLLTGTVEIQATSATTDLSEIDLDFYEPMVVDAVRVDGSPVSFLHDFHTLTVYFAGAYQPGEPFTVACEYHGNPYYNLRPFRWSAHGDVPMVLTYSEPYGAPAWWVCKDDPKDKATFSIHVTAPDTLTTVSNGYLASVADNGDGTATCHWLTDYPMSAYLFSIATTNFTKWTEVYTALDGSTTMNVDYFAYPEDSAAAQVSWSRNMEMMEYYAGLFGEYPFLDEKYAIAEFQHPGAMEHQTATSYGNEWIDGTHANDYIVVHELAHSWVGDMITMTAWSHAWCKEGFATLCEALYFEDKYGESYYHDYMDSLHVLDYAGSRIYNPFNPVAAVIYYKGAWVLHMLRHVIGDAAFFDGVYDYANDPDFRYGVANTEDLRGVFEAASGTDLVWFFDEWVYNPGYPTYDLSWWAAPARSGYDVTLAIDQTQTGWPIFKMPIDIAVDTPLGEERFVVWDSLASQEFTLHVEGEPRVLELDPDHWLIKEVTTPAAVAAGECSREAITLRNRPNPFSPATVIDFELAQPGRVRLRVYDAAGRLVRELADGPAGAGAHRVTWDGRTAGGGDLPPGVYFCRLDTDTQGSTRRMVLLR